MTHSDKTLIEKLLSHVPADGRAIGNKKLMELLASEPDLNFSEDDYKRIRDQLVKRGVLAKGGGKAGSVKLLEKKDTESQTVAADSTLTIM